MLYALSEPLLNIIAAQLEEILQPYGYDHNILERLLADDLVTVWLYGF